MPKIEAPPDSYAPSFIVEEAGQLVPRLDNPLEQPLPQPDPMVDQNPGLSTPIVVGHNVLHRTILDIARARSNKGFLELTDPEKYPSTPARVKEFADQLDTTPQEAMRLVKGSIQPTRSQKPRSRLTHYDRAQYRLNRLADKERTRTLKYHEEHPDTDISLVEGMLPVATSDVEYDYFNANTPAETKAKARLRQKIAKSSKLK
jgi:hypothetical protein